MVIRTCPRNTYIIINGMIPTRQWFQKNEPSMSSADIAKGYYVLAWKEAVNGDSHVTATPGSQYWEIFFERLNNPSGISD